MVINNSFYSANQTLCMVRQNSIIPEKNYVNPLPAEKAQVSAETLVNTETKNNNNRNKLLLAAGITASAVAALGMIKRGRRSPEITPVTSNQSVGGITKPKFLYHITKLENYESIMRDGVLKKSSPEIGDGVFFSDINDIKNKFANTALSRMLRYYKGDKNGVAVIKIAVPEGTMENSIKWRQLNYGENRGRIVSQEWNELKDFCASDKEALHGEPLEYLYTSEIETSKFDFVKIIDLSDENIIRDFKNTIREWN